MDRTSYSRTDRQVIIECVSSCDRLCTDRQRTMSSASTPTPMPREDPGNRFPRRFCCSIGNGKHFVRQRLRSSLDGKVRGFSYVYFWLTSC